MGNGLRCCLTGVCCTRAKQKAALVKALIAEAECNETHAGILADWIQAHLSLEDFLAAVSETVKKHKDEAA